MIRFRPPQPLKSLTTTHNHNRIREVCEMPKLIAAFVVVFGLSVTARAQTDQANDALVAYDRGDYAIALKLAMPLATLTCPLWRDHPEGESVLMMLPS